MVRAKRGVGRHDDANGTVHAGKLFDRRDVFDVAHAGAAVFVRKNHAEQTELAEFFDGSERKLRGFVPFHYVGSDFARGELAHGFLEVQLLVV
jgi:hypothetical protein